jgi:hypothetical protein
MQSVYHSGCSVGLTSGKPDILDLRLGFSLSGKDFQAARHRQWFIEK